MKTSLWKILFVLGAVILGAALLVPKSLRDKTEKGAVPVSTAAQSDANIDVINSTALVFRGVTFAEPDVVEHCILYISEAISDGRRQIFHGFTLKEAADLVLALSAGTTPAKLRPVD